MGNFTYEFNLKCRKIILYFINVPNKGYGFLFDNLAIVNGLEDEIVERVQSYNIDGAIHFIGYIINGAVGWKILLSNIKREPPNCDVIEFDIDWETQKILNYRKLST